VAPPTKTARLIFLGRKSGFLIRERVFRFPDGLQVDVVLGAQVRCQRVFFDEVHLVTLHRARGWLLLLVTGILFLVAAGASLLVGAISGLPTGLGIFFLTALPAAVAFFVRLGLGVDVVTVHGKRSRAVMHFSLKKARAREVFLLVARLARERQDRRGREQRAAPSPAPPPFPSLST
jgi:hypothetical protein